MALEMVAGRLVTRHLGSSVFGWTSIIGVLLGGLSLGDLIGGRLANGLRREGQASHLFLLGSVLTLWVILAETPPTWLAAGPLSIFRPGDEARPRRSPSAACRSSRWPSTCTATRGPCGC